MKPQNQSTYASLWTRWTRLVAMFVLLSLAPDALAAPPGVLVFSRGSQATSEFVDGFSGELEGDFKVSVFHYAKDTSVDEIREALAGSSPEVVILMDNPMVRLWSHVQAASDAPEALPRAVIVMALFLDEISSELHNTTGIYYEPPAVTSLSRLRAVSGKPVARIGVVHRPFISNFVQRQSQLAAREQFDIIPIEVPAAPTPQQLRAALKTLQKKENVDAIWVLNDNGLLTQDLIQYGWAPVLRRETRPVLVGVPTLLSLGVPFGNFATTPDHFELGLQAAEQVWNLYDADWDVKEVPPELPVVVRTYIKGGFAQKHWGTTEQQLKTVDEHLP